MSYVVNDGQGNSNVQTSLIEVLDLVPAQPLPHCEDFETEGHGTRYAANRFNLGPNDIFDRGPVDKDALTGSNGEGAFAFVGEDTDADGSSVHSIEIVVETAGATDLMLDLKLAAALNQFETSDLIRVEVESDGAAPVRLASFRGSSTNSSLSLDGDENGTGDGVTLLVPDYTDFNFPLPAADETRIRITMNTSATSEEVAVDYVCVTGTDTEAPIADLANPLNGASAEQPAINADGYIDVTFTDVGFNGIDVATIDGDELVLSGVGAAGVNLVAGAPSLVSGTTYRYFVDTGSFSPGAVVVDFPAGGFADLGGILNAAETEGFTVANSPPIAGDDLVERHPTVSVKIPVADLLANDIDPGLGTNAGLSITGVNYTGGNGADLTLDGDTIFYDPNGFQGNDIFSYTVEDSGGESAVATVSVLATQGNGATFNVVDVQIAGGQAEIAGVGIPGRSYRGQHSSDLINWTTFATVVADPFGRIEMTDPGPLPPVRFYRIIQP